MAKKTRQVPVEEIEQSTPEEPSGRVMSLPSVLSRGRKKEETAEVQEEERGIRRMSSDSDTVLTLDEYNGVNEILHPGRNQDELDARTEVNTLQIIHFSRARVMAKRFGIRYLDQYVTQIERLSLSHKRKSRLEHVKALSGLHEQNGNAPSLLQRLG